MKKGVVENVKSEIEVAYLPAGIYFIRVSGISHKLVKG